MEVVEELRYIDSLWSSPVYWARPEAVYTDDGAEIIQQLKEKFALTKSIELC